MPPRRSRAPVAPDRRAEKSGSGPDPLPTTDLLLRLFTGRRHSERSLCRLEARLEGALGRIPATVLDISRHGVLAEIDHPEFAASAHSGGLLAYGRLLEEHAARGLTLLFPALDLRRSAHIVRWTTGSAGGDPARVGLRFDPPLERAQYQALCRSCGARLQPDRRAGR